MKEPVDGSVPSSLITDHPYESMGEWWDLCKHCKLAQAAHASSTPEAIAAKKAHFEQAKRATPMRLPSYEREFDPSGRPLVSYMGDDEDD